MDAPHPAQAEVSGGQGGSIPLPPLLLQKLLEALHAIRYGTIELVIHDGRVVQLERREKVRFEQGGADHRRG